MTSQDLAALRKSLDDIDAVLVSALGERARLVAADRRREGRRGRARCATPTARRRCCSIARRSASGSGSIPRSCAGSSARSWTTRCGASRTRCRTATTDVEQEIRVAFQGTEGAYGHQAALQHFAVVQRPVGFKAYGTFKDMLEAVIEGHVDRAMLPIENTTAGSVYESYDLLLRFNLSLVGEEIVDVRHCLLGVADVPIESLRRIHSHPQALSQCSEFLVDAARVRRRQRREHRAGREARARAEQPGRSGDRQRGSRRAFRTERVEARHRQPAGQLHAVRRGGGVRRRTATRESPPRCRWCCRRATSTARWSGA